MATESLTERIEGLKTRKPQRLWGISPESLFIATSAVATGEPVEQAVAPLHKLAVFESNDERSLKHVSKAHIALLEEIGLTNGRTLTDLGRVVVMADTPSAAIRVAAVRRLDRLSAVLRELRILETDTVTKQNLESILHGEYDKTVIVPLIGSLGFATIRPEGAYLDLDVIEKALDSNGETNNSKPVRAVSLFQSLTKSNRGTAIRLAERLIEDTIDSGTVPDDDITRVAIVAATEPQTITLETLEAAVNAYQDELESTAIHYRELLTPGTESDPTLSTPEQAITRAEIDESLDSHESELTDVIVGVLSAIRNGELPSRIDLNFLTDRTDFSEHELFTSFQTIPEVSVEMSGSNTLDFIGVPAVDGEGSLEGEYTDFLLQRYQRTRAKQERLEPEITVTPQQVERVITAAIHRVPDDVVAPVYFAYTLPDPDALGQERMDKYVDDSTPLKEERIELQRWARTRRDDLKRFKTLTDRLFTRGIEHDLEEQILRIMTPYDDDTFEEYASQIRSLLRAGYEIRLITRHTKDPYEWGRLRDSLLGGLDENRDKITIRTYSRYKEYVNISRLEDDEPRGEFGVHAKLQTIGHAEEGVALVGSANFMENSYNWNPECGMYTENVNFVRAAIDFFDHVWELSAPDEVDLERLPDVPNQTLYPNYYT